AGGGDDRLAGAATLTDAVIVGFEVGRVSHGNEAALYQGGPRQLVAAFGDPAAIVGLVGLADAGHDAEVGGELVGALEVMNVADRREQHGGRTGPHALDAGQARIALEGRGDALDLAVEAGKARGERQRLLAQDLHLSPFARSEE